MEIRGKAKMLELTIYGLTGPAAVLVIAFFLHSVMNSPRYERQFSFDLSVRHT
jgi:uncharacterized membrane protein YuzA (DUF378 family)